MSKGKQGGPRETFLTSTAIQKQEVYPFHEGGFLVPHETLRRELLRAEHALNHMQVIKYGFQFRNFHIWVIDFFIPAVFAHHDAEENVLGPFYQALGAEVPFGKELNHEHVVDLMNTFRGNTVHVFKLVKAYHAEGEKNAAKEAEIEAAYEVLKESFNKFHQDMNLHFAEEERDWTPIYLKYGEVAHKEVVEKIINTEMSKKGAELQAFELMCGAIVDNIGWQTEHYPSLVPNALQLAPWASEKQAESFMLDVPFVPRKFIFPGLRRRYYYSWRFRIDSCVAETDVFPTLIPPRNGCMLS